MPPTPPPDNWNNAHVPFYKDANRALGAIKRVLSIPCAPTPTVYIEAAVSGIWRAASSIISPDPKEMYHQALGNSLYHDIKGTLEDAHLVEPRDGSPLTRGAFELADMVDVTLWRMFVFGSVVDGLVDFSTQLQFYAGCNNKHSPNFFSGGPYINAIADDGAYYADLFAGQLGSGVGAVGPAAFKLGGGYGGFAAASCAFTDFAGQIPAPADTAIMDVFSGQVYDMGSASLNDEGHQQAGHAFYKNQGSSGLPTILDSRSRYTGGTPLPLGEAFRDGQKWHGYSNQTHPGGS